MKVTMTDVRRFSRELKRIASFKKREAIVFLQLDDPQSYLLAHFLSTVTGNYPKVSFRYCLCQALRDAAARDTAEQADLIVKEGRKTAAALGVPFLDKGRAPVAEHRRAMLEYLAEEHDEDTFADTMTTALRLYWRGDSKGVSALLGNRYSALSEAHVLIGKNQLLLRKLGSTRTASIYYDGGWFSGIDELPLLIQSLDDAALARFNEPDAGIAAIRSLLKQKE